MQPWWPQEDSTEKVKKFILFENKYICAFIKLHSYLIGTTLLWNTIQHVLLSNLTVDSGREALWFGIRPQSAPLRPTKTGSFQEFGPAS